MTIAYIDMINTLGKARLVGFGVGLGLIVGIGSSVLAASFTVNSTDSLLAVCQKILGTTPPVATSTVPTVPPVVLSPAGETRFIAYTTGYGWPDNTPAGNAISDGVLHQGASGTGTFSDPITLAVGHSIINGKDILDYPAGTKFYVPNLRRYFIAEDTCGDGSSPQNGPCHTGYQGHVWIDLWVGGQGLSKASTLSCEDSITDFHLAIRNPASNYAVVSGPVYNGTCATQYGDAILTQ